MLNAFTADLSLVWHTRGDVRYYSLSYLAFALLDVWFLLGTWYRVRTNCITQFTSFRDPTRRELLC